MYPQPRKALFSVAPDLTAAPSQGTCPGLEDPASPHRIIHSPGPGSYSFGLSLSLSNTLKSSVETLQRPTLWFLKHLCSTAVRPHGCSGGRAERLAAHLHLLCSDSPLEQHSCSPGLWALCLLPCPSCSSLWVSYLHLPGALPYLCPSPASFPSPDLFLSQASSPPPRILSFNFLCLGEVSYDSSTHVGH